MMGCATRLTHLDLGTIMVSKHMLILKGPIPNPGWLPDRQRAARDNDLRC